MACSGTSIIIILLTIFKETFIKELKESDPEVFTEKLLGGFLLPYVVVMTLYGYLFTMLNKRTIELSQATKLAEEALEQQKTFLYSFSHEMRNPMNSLLGNLDLVLLTNLPNKTREMVNTAKICGMLLLNLINTVLDAGKLDFGKLEINPIPTRVYDIFQRIWAISNDLLTQKGLKSHLKVEKKVPHKLLLDGHRINQVLMNLIGNAIKFTEKGLVTLTVKWQESSGEVCETSFEPVPYDYEDEGVFEKEDNMAMMNMTYHTQKSRDYFILSGGNREFILEGAEAQPAKEMKGVLKIIIRDTGSGIKQNDLDKLFNKFSQVGNDTSKKQMGTGLGLFISRQICRNMGGDIRIYSKPNIGTTAVICIPAVALPSRHKLSNESDLSNVIKELSEWKLQTLVADDSPFNVNLVSSFFSKIGAKVITKASNGLAAYERYVESLEAGIIIDIVTLDIDMPLLNGKQACEKIREYEKARNIEPCIIVLISGNYKEENIHNFLNENSGRKADCFLRKPLLFQDFCWALHRQMIEAKKAKVCSSKRNM